MRVGSLFAGIGGFDLGLQRAGCEISWQVEIDPFCRAVLAKHWPHVARFPDVHFVSRDNLAPVDIVCGGFPCQDLSPAGRQAGIEKGHRSGLWREFRRIIGELRPRYVVIENTHRAWRKWVPVVRSDLGSLGFASLSIRVRASDFGGWHERARAFVVAWSAPHADGPWQLQPQGGEQGERGRPSDCSWWDAEPGLPRLVHGLPAGLDRRQRAAREKALGNAIVPQAAEWIGRALMETTP